MTNISEVLNSVEVEVDRANLPSGTVGVRASFANAIPEFYGYSATVIADTVSSGDSVASEGERLVSIVARFPRCILSEINTHRVFSRNSASSRARSIKTTIREVLENPYVPLFTVNRKGMSGDFADDETRQAAIGEWLEARNEAVVSALRLLMGEYVQLGDALNNWETYVDTYYEKVYNADSPLEGALNIHKQNVNRLLEPFMWHEVLITSSYWSNFFNLRIEENAQPEMYAIARLMYEAVESSQPKVSNFHLPFIGEEDFANADEVLDAMVRSAGQSAQISYRPIDKGGRGANPLSLGKRLLESGHMSPFEHQALSAKAYEEMVDQDYQSGLGGNLGDRWVQYRKILETSI